MQTHCKQVLEFVRAITSCNEESLPIRYLGIPIGKGKTTRKDWDPLFNKVEKRLEGWKAKSLTLSGWSW